MLNNLCDSCSKCFLGLGDTSTNMEGGGGLKTLRCPGALGNPHCCRIGYPEELPSCRKSRVLAPAHQPRKCLCEFAWPGERAVEDGGLGKHAESTGFQAARALGLVRTLTLTLQPPLWGFSVHSAWSTLARTPLLATPCRGVKDGASGCDLVVPEEAACVSQWKDSEQPGKGCHLYLCICLQYLHSPITVFLTHIRSSGGS